MNPKVLLSIAATLVAIVLVVFFPKLAGPGAEPAGADAPASAIENASRSGVNSPETGREATSPKSVDAPVRNAPAPRAETTPSKPAAPSNTVGFGSQRSYDEHFEKHGGEFGSITKAEYLALAQKLRDAPVGGAILEAVRDDGVISRFDKKSGAFLAFNQNKTIRTFFKPNDGVRYFERQIDKEH